METRFVDCRPREAYLAAHIPGAAHADPEGDLTGDVGGGRHPLPSADAFAAWASAAGIGPDTLVVGYDDGTGWAARLWWLLRHFGHDDAGGDPARRLERPARGRRGGDRAGDVRRRGRGRTTPPTPPSSSTGSATTSLTLVDARAPERWRGETEPIDPVAGRIPGARNRFFLDESPLPGELLDAPDLVVYCGSGVTACAVLHELHLAGRDDARLYPGSFSEWYALGPVERD